MTKQMRKISKTATVYIKLEHCNLLYTGKTRKKCVTRTKEHERKCHQYPKADESLPGQHYNDHRHEIRKAQKKKEENNKI